MGEGGGVRARQWPRRIATVLAVALGTVGTLVSWFLIEANRRIEHKREALARELPGVLAADEKFIRPILEHPLFTQSEGDDAGPFLNDRLSWTAERGSLLPAECRAALADAGLEWRSLDRAELQGCDTNWLHELRRFGRWSLNSGFRERLAPGPRSDFALPNMMDLQDAVKLHLVLARPENAEEAAQDVRHLAHLLFTQHYLLSAMIGIALLRIEARSQELATRPWSEPPLTAGQRDAVPRHLFSAVFALNALAPTSLTEAAMEGMHGYRRCLLVTEYAFMGKRAQLADPLDCRLDHAQWELAHPIEQAAITEGPISPSAALSPPAQGGAWLTARLAPETYRGIAAQLVEADILPAEGRWGSGQSEFRDRVTDPR